MGGVQKEEGEETSVKKYRKCFTFCRNTDCISLVTFLGDTQDIVSSSYSGRGGGTAGGGVLQCVAVCCSTMKV